MQYELYHHGVKGQKWGVRRYQNKDGSLTKAGKRKLREEIRQERSRFIKSETDRLEKEYDIAGKEKAAYAYGKKHKLDLDDGGGGSVRAGQKYTQMWDDIEQLRTTIEYKAKRSAEKHVKGKFGETTIKELNDHDNAVWQAKTTAACATLATIPVAVVIGLIALDK